MIKTFLTFCLWTIFSISGNAQWQSPPNTSSLLLSLKKLKNVSSVLYIAAHPDDENTRLLAYLANERCVRAGYLSLTRGDGGQNLIGDEQGIELGMIRTQELLAARRIDGAEQFFSRAFDFGYTKSPKEALSIWGHDKILSDVVWVIRRFQPDVIITRFPTTGEGGHGHHTASAILAVEAIKAAADPNQFPEQMKYGVRPWQAKRLFWNTFNFGSVNTQRPDQLKMDVGEYNPLLGMSYGEMAAKSRSQHKSQGFGVPAQRGKVLEYFKQLYGDHATNDILENISQNWSRYNLKSIDESIDNIITHFDPFHPDKMIPALSQIRKQIVSSSLDSIFKNRKLKQIDELITSASGIFMETTSPVQVHVIGNPVQLTFSLNVPEQVPVKYVAVTINGERWVYEPVHVNDPITGELEIPVTESMRTQPYWLKNPMNHGSYNIPNQKEIGLAEKPSLTVRYDILWKDGTTTQITRPVWYKHTDPVRGEIYEPIVFTDSVTASMHPSLMLFKESEKMIKTANAELTKHGVKSINNITLTLGKGDKIVDLAGMEPGGKRSYGIDINPDQFPDHYNDHLALTDGKNPFNDLHEIKYEHIPDIFYHSVAELGIIKTDLKIIGKKIGYINGAGDKMVEGLSQMGYHVTMLTEADIRKMNLSEFDAIVTGVRAYNVNSWMPDVYSILMNYVKQGGVLLVQYNTNSNLGPLQAKIGPYPFQVSRTRITDETATVNFIDRTDSLLHFPNQITSNDFEGWIQERSIYQAENTDSHYQKLFSMHDPGENNSDGSLIYTNYGKGRFVYTGIVFFREIPAGVPGAYRLLANLLAKP